jgi:cell wall assembly regulator SMI1
MRTHTPHTWQLLLPGASETDIHQTEITLDITFPEDFKASYRFHNGGYMMRLVSEMQILPLEKLFRIGKYLKKSRKEEVGMIFSPITSQTM